MARTARSCERTAHSSCSVRLMPYSRRRFSAVSIMPPGTGNRVPPELRRGSASRSLRWGTPPWFHRASGR